MFLKVAESIYDVRADKLRRTFFAAAALHHSGSTLSQGSRAEEEDVSERSLRF